jgi:D-beta-D-heptose 7-phosphate kinase / D-beta-D-heptose 1-phosphate adenosyltransferase
MNDLLEKLKMSDGKKILVVGDVMLDTYVFGNVERISPEAPVPVLNEERCEWCCGGASNVAVNCKKINFDVQLIGIVGKKDEDGRRLVSMLKNEGIKTDGMVLSNYRQTTSKERLMAQQQQLLRIDRENKKTLSVEEYTLLISRINLLLEPNMLVLISDYAKGVINSEVISEILKVAKERNCLILVDPKGPNFNKYYGVDYIKPNAKEFDQMVCFFGLSTNDSMIENGRIICDMLSLKGLIVTMGEKGIQFISRESCFLSPVHKHDVFDVTGAGDTVLAYIALGIVNKLSWKDCLNVANRAAAVAISHVKTYSVVLDELIDSHENFEVKIISDWEKLGNKLKVLHQQYKSKVVFTNGCFDLLHTGHLHVLKEAKKHGDILVVALNTDASVKRFKGDSRPIKKLEERIALMAALEIVDFVTIFDQDTPYELIKFLKPDVLVKGGDYQKEEIAGADIVQANGGEVVIIDYKNGYSTTNLIKAMGREQNI